jgi:hypothetical protein
MMKSIRLRSVLFHHIPLHSRNAYVPENRREVNTAHYRKRCKQIATITYNTVTTQHNALHAKCSRCICPSLGKYPCFRVVEETSRKELLRFVTHVREQLMQEGVARSSDACVN